MRNVMAMLAAFAVGALLMIGIRGTGTIHAEGLPERAQAPAAHQGEGAHGDHGSQADHTAQGTQADHAAQGTQADHAAHAAHGAAAQVAQAAPAEKAPVTAAATTKTVDLWVCAQDDKYALSWEGDCPLDGKPMVKKTVDASTLKDLKNERCPIMGGETKDDIYAVYDGTMVHFCCPGCDGKFFKAPADHIKKLSEKK